MPDHAEEREIAREMARNPIMKELSEALVRYECWVERADPDAPCPADEVATAGFIDPLARERIRRLLGDEGADRWDQICRKMREALGETPA